MNSSYSLRLGTPIWAGANIVPLQDITSIAGGWKRSHKFLGGPWIGTFTIRDISRTEMEEWFYKYLGYDVRETVKGIVRWSGFIWEIDYVTFDDRHWTRKNKQGYRLRRTYDGMANRAMLEYTEWIRQEDLETDWFENTASQKLLGKKEEILYDEVFEADADDVVKEFLALNSKGNVHIVGIEEVAEPYLEITVVGYVTSCQFLYAAGGNVDEGTTTVGSWIADLIDQVEGIASKTVVGNSRAIQRVVNGHTKIWDLLTKLSLLPDTSDPPTRYRLYCENDARRMRYVITSKNPIGYFVNGQFFTLDYQDLAANPRYLEPGIYRNPTAGLDLTFTKAVDPFLAHPGDFLVSEVEVDADGLINAKTDGWDRENALRSFTLPDIVKGQAYWDEVRKRALRIKQISKWKDQKAAQKELKKLRKEWGEGPWWDWQRWYPDDDEEEF